MNATDEEDRKGNRSEPGTARKEAKVFPGEYDDEDVAANRRLQFAGAAMHAAAELLFRECSKPALDEIDPRLDEIDPRAARRCEVDMEAGMPGQLAVDQRRLVRAGIVDDEMNVEQRRNGVVDRIEKCAELARPVPLVELSDDLAALGVQGREERR